MSIEKLATFDTTSRFSSPVRNASKRWSRTDCEVWPVMSGASSRSAAARSWSRY